MLEGVTSRKKMEKKSIVMDVGNESQSDEAIWFEASSNQECPKTNEEQTCDRTVKKPFLKKRHKNEGKDSREESVRSYWIGLQEPASRPSLKNEGRQRSKRHVKRYPRSEIKNPEFEFHSINRSPSKERKKLEFCIPDEPLKIETLLSEDWMEVACNFIHSDPGGDDC